MVISDRHYFQAVLESQKNIIIVLEKGVIQSVNKAFLTFFDVKSVEDFYNHHLSLCDIMLHAKQSKTTPMDEESWLTLLLEHPLTTHKITLRKDTFEHVFMAGASSIEGTPYTVLSLTDITLLENERKMYEKAATTDTLTGIANRLKFNTILGQQIAFSKRYQETFSLVMFDIDFFKKVNDTYGHKMGDEVLIMLSESVLKFLRSSDTFARWGGEEFAIILPNTTESEAFDLTEKIREKIAHLRFGEGFQVTCSFGISEYKNHEDSDVFIKEVDWLLYKAKKSGKNRVCCL